MDGCFVPNISFGMPIIAAIRSKTELIVDVHAMIVKPNKYIDDFISAGADIITFHLEALEHDEILKSIEKIHSKGVKVGISIKPNTKAEELIPYLPLIDMVLVMTVEPGFGGQKFMNEMMEKVKFLRNLIQKNNLNVDIQVDGGINNETIKISKDAGANIFVLGTAFFKSEDLITVEKLLSE